MSDSGYVLGIIVNQSTGEPQPITTPAVNIVGIVGTAPASTALTINYPASFLGKKAALEAIFPKDSKAEKGTLYSSVIGVQEQGTARMILIKAASEKDEDIEAAIEALLLSKSVTGYKPKILIVSGFGNDNRSAPAPAPGSTRAAPVTSKLQEIVNG